MLCVIQVMINIKQYNNDRSCVSPENIQLLHSTNILPKYVSLPQHLYLDRESMTIIGCKNSTRLPDFLTIFECGSFTILLVMKHFSSAWWHENKAVERFCPPEVDDRGLIMVSWRVYGLIRPGHPPRLAAE